MSEHYYRLLKSGEYVHIGDEILIYGNWYIIFKSDYINQKYCNYLVADNSPNIRRCYPESLHNIEASNRAINAFLNQIHEENHELMPLRTQFKR